MLIPGYVATFTDALQDAGEHLMPCHEFCGTGTRRCGAVQVVDKASFAKLAARTAEAELC